jgi:hypothetical protein
VVSPLTTFAAFPAGVVFVAAACCTWGSVAAGAAAAVCSPSLRISNAGATGRIDRRGGVLVAAGAGAWFDAWLVAASSVDAFTSGSGFFESRGGFFWKIREKTLIYFPLRAAAT